MQELLGRMQTLDPQAGAELRIVAQFDALIGERVGVEGLLRAAATLSGCGAGFHDQHRTVVIDEHGRRHDHGHGPDPGMGRSAVPGLSSAEVWLTRTAQPLPSDGMVLERLALAVEIIERRRTAAVDPLRTVIDPAAAEVERRQAIGMLGLSGDQRVRMIAVPADGATSTARSTMIIIDGERLLAVLDSGREPRPGRENRPDRAPPGPVGLGVRRTPDGLAESWQTAVTALRLAGTLVSVVDAEEVGIVSALAILARSEDPHPDQLRLAEILVQVPWAEATVEALVMTNSRRAAAAALGIHHATLQARVERLNSLLGYDLATTWGSHRLLIGHLLCRLGAGQGRR